MIRPSLVQDARILKLFRASDTLATALAGRWMERATYEGAPRMIRSVLDPEKLIDLEHEPCRATYLTGGSSVTPDGFMPRLL
jgi:DNA helicase-2/ATP-dependent DNA helicase PcrA